MTRRALLFSLVLLAGCAGSRSPEPPATRAALAERCDRLTAAAPDNFVPLADVTGPAEAGAPEPQVEPTDAFAQAAASAEGVWHYDSTDDTMGFKTGETGIVAITGCEIVARQTHIIYN